MVKLGLITDYKRKVLIWDGVSVPMRSVYHTDSKPTFSRAEIKQIMTQLLTPISTWQLMRWLLLVGDHP
jgi:hypothetical protein